METLAKKIIQEQLSVRAVEKLVKELQKPKEKKKEKERDIHMEAVCHRLEDRFQTNVTIDKHHISIRYEDVNDLNRILEMLGGLEE